MITQAIQDYLKVIYKLGRDDNPVNTNAIADRMEVSQASVTGMVKKLSELKLIRYKPYYGVELTQAGRKIALETIRHHRLLELYLAQALGYSWDRVHEEAEKLEHHISEEFEDRMAEFLGDPAFDPHGAPIPSKDGKIVERELVLLTSADVGQTVKVKQVSDGDPEMLRYLAAIGILPGIELDILEKAPFGGPLHVRIGEAEHHLGEGLTSQIYISTL
ncbi:MAG: metal-dependent transcriptional regulator [bacterium]